MADPEAARRPSRSPTVGVVSLTQGTRPEDLAAGLASVLAQQDVVVDLVVVGNGWEPQGLPEAARAVHLPQNLGITAGRNAGARAVTGEYIFFLDDDARLPSPTFLRDAIDLIRSDPGIGLIQPRVVDPGGRANPRRWVPRIRKGSASEPSDVFSVWEGATLLPRRVFDAVGGWGEPYFYAHEGIELAWRVWDLGLRARYAAELIAHHPANEPTRHAFFYRLNARNRVWLAKRNLPWVLAPVYVLSWTGVQLVRAGLRNPRTLRPWFRGWWEGVRTSPGGRRSIKWVTVWRMTRSGRPPLI